MPKTTASQLFCPGPESLNGSLCKSATSKRTEHISLTISLIDALTFSVSARQNLTYFGSTSFVTGARIEKSVLLNLQQKIETRFNSGDREGPMILCLSETSNNANEFLSFDKAESNTDEKVTAACRLNCVVTVVQEIASDGDQ